MSEFSDPPRLATDPNAGTLGDWFRDAQDDLPSPQRLARVAEQLAPAFATPSPTSLSVKPLTRLLLGAFGVTGVGLMALALRGGKTESRPSGPLAPAVTASAAPVSRPSGASPALALSTPAPPVLEIPLPAAAPNDAPRNSRPSRDVARPTLSEAALLEQARRSLGSDPTRALALTRQHQTRFPYGSLRQEREVIAIEALRRLGRGKAAEQRADSFEKAFPDSAHRRAVETGHSARPLEDKR